MNNILSKISSRVDRILDYAVEKQNSIGITVFLHILVLFILTNIYFRTQPKPEEHVFDISFSEEVEQRPVEEVEEEDNPYMTKSEQRILTNKASNEQIDPEIAKLRAKMSSLSDMDDKTDLFGEGAENRIQKEQEKVEKPSEGDAKKDDKDAVLEKEIFTGNSNISYKLKNRYEVRLPNPVYTCISGGKVVVNISVNPNGFVTKTSINKKQSSTNECLHESALEYAKKAKFNSSASAPNSQKGSITYIFQ